MADNSSLLKKAANLLFKGLGKLFSDYEPIDKEGKLGIRVKVPAVDKDTRKFLGTITADLFAVKGKDVYYCDTVKVVDDDGKEVKVKKYGPVTLGTSDDDIKKMINDFASKQDISIAPEWEPDNKGDNKDSSKESEDSTPQDSASEDTEQADQPKQDASQSHKLKVTFAKVEGSSSLSAYNISSNYSYIRSAEDVLSLSEDPNIMALVPDESPMTLEVVDEGDAFDVTVCEDCSQVELADTYNSVFNAILGIKLGCDLAMWTSTNSETGYRFSDVVYALDDVLKQIAGKLNHLGVSVHESYFEIPSYSSAEDAASSASGLLYLASNSMPDPTVFDANIKQLDTLINNWACPANNCISPVSC